MTTETTLTTPMDTPRDRFEDICGTMLDIKSLEDWAERSGTTPEITAEMAALDARLDDLMIAHWPKVVASVGIDRIRATLEWLGV